MIKLRWYPAPDAVIASYHVYRSMVGFRAPLVDPSTVAGLTLVLSLNGGAPQTFTFNGTGPDLVTQINATIAGGLAYASIADPAYFFVRSDIRRAPGSVAITGGTALSALSLTARTITERSEDLLITTLSPLPDPADVVTYDDPDGVLQDWYSITTVDNHACESARSQYRQPVTSTGDLCVLEGVVIDLQGVRIPDALVKATISQVPDSADQGAQVTTAPIETLTGPDGRFSLALLQGILVRLEIPAVNFGRNLKVPNQAFVYINDLCVDTDYQFKPDPYIGAT